MLDDVVALCTLLEDPAASLDKKFTEMCATYDRARAATGMEFGRVSFTAATEAVRVYHAMHDLLGKDSRATSFIADVTLDRIKSVTTDMLTAILEMLDEED